MANSRPGEAIFVTGGAGFIGSHLVESLVARGDRVTIYDDFDPYYDAALKVKNIEQALGTGAARLIEGDIRDEPSLRGAIEATRPDKVVHLAARPGVRPSFEVPEVYLDINVAGSLILLRACREVGVRQVVFASSSSVYGSVERPANEESTPCRPLSPYGASKVAGEALCSAFARDGMSIVSLRFFTAYGPRQRPDMAINHFVRAIYAGEPISVFGDGSSRRDYTYISDIVDGIVRSIDHDAAGFDVFNLGRGEPVILRDVLQALEDRLGRPADLRHVDPQPGDPQMTCADITRARERLGYEPKVSAEEGLTRYAEWFLEQQHERVGSR